MKKLSIKVGEYEKDGEKKGRYVNLGVILQNKDGSGEFALIDPTVDLAGCLMLQAMLNRAAGKETGDRIMCGIFDEAGASRAKSAPSGDSLNDPIPF